jgi:hypothetical protein
MGQFWLPISSNFWISMISSALVSCCCKQAFSRVRRATWSASGLRGAGFGPGGTAAKVASPGLRRSRHLANVETTIATTPDDAVTAQIHASLNQRDLLPDVHLSPTGATLMPSCWSKASGSISSICSAQFVVIIGGKGKKTKALLRPILQLTGRRSRRDVRPDVRVSIGTRPLTSAKVQSLLLYTRR